MIAELSHAEGDRAALAFAGGCLRAALQQRAGDHATQFAIASWSIAAVSAAFAAAQLSCAIRGVRVLFGERDGMLDGMLHHGASAALMARYESARPIVISCFLALGATQVAAAWFLSRGEFQRLLIAWCASLIVASIAVAIQLSIIWSIDGVPSEFHALLVQAVTVPALLAWSRHGQNRSRRWS